MVFWNRDISRGCLHVAFLHGESFFLTWQVVYIRKGLEMQRNQVLGSQSETFQFGIWGFVSFATAVNQTRLFLSFCPCDANSVWITSKHLWTRTSALLSLFPVVPASIGVFPKRRECEVCHSSLPAGSECYSRTWKSTLFFITTLRTSSDMFSHFGHCQRNDLRTCAPVTDGCRGWR